MEIVRNIARHKLRSFLTISGIVIGVLALTTMGAMAENFNALLNGGVAYFGQNVQVGPPDERTDDDLIFERLSRGVPFGWRLLKGKRARRFLKWSLRQEARYQREQAASKAAGGAN